MITDVREFLSQLANIDQRAAMWCACKCARTVLHLVPEGEDRPRGAIEVAEEWVRGNATKRQLRRVAGRVGPATRPEGIYEAAHAAARAASHAAGDGDEFTSFSAGSVVDAVRHAVRLAGLDLPEHHHLALVSSERWPLTVPALEQLTIAPEVVQVAWDAVSDDRTEHTIPELLESHARAIRLGLNWNDPVQRAVAERAFDEEKIRTLLTSQEKP